MKLTGDIVKFLRSLKGMQQSELAKKTGLTQATISRIETNRVALTPMNNIRLLRAFNMNEVEVLEVFNEMSKLNAFKNKIK